MNITTDTKLIGKRESFYKLFSDNNYIIEIPTIQRDYAQGRKSTGEVRELFLQALYDYLEDNIPNRDLDFVYGSNETDRGEIKFIPLDGQQRLTTLFLLHWYLANISKEEKRRNFRDIMSHNGKSKFTYLTRPSSAEFMDALVRNEIDFSCLLEGDHGQGNSLSKTIMDKGWYFLSWGYDPTISSMLRMLDAIHAKFNNCAHFYDRLINKDSPIITFLFLDLKKFKLTEDLYIKMNSRGKPLTAFENFKAKFEQHISKLFGDSEKIFTLPPDNRLVSRREYFAYQIDTTWANLFWHYKQLVGRPNTFDEELMNFIRVIIANQYAIDNSEQLEHLRELVKNESATSEITESLSFYKFEGMGSLTVNCVNYLIDGLNALENKGKPIANHLTNTFYFNENDIFEKALKYSLSQPERVMFHAYLRYLIIHKNDTTNLQQWMRVVHNLVENTRVDALAEFIGAIKSIDHLLEHSSDILHYLLEPKNKVEFFSTWQVEEERLKAHLSTSSVWLDVIMKCEEQNFHRGQIAYLFEFSGILEYFNEHKNIKWSVEDDQNFLSAFRYYMERSDALFSILDTKANGHYLLERAILSKGDYLILATNNRFNFCSSKSVSNYLRDYSWKRLLRVTTDDDSETYKTKRNFVMEVLTDPRFNTKNVETSLMKLVEDLPSDWRANFVRNPGLMDYCGQGFICMTNDGEVELLGQSQLNHYHINMFIYNIYLANIDRMDQFKPFKEMLPIPVKNNEDSSLVTFTDWKFKNKNYCIDITKHVNGFFIEFVKEKGKTKRVDYDINLEKVLLNNNMLWDETVESFTMIKRTEKSTIDFIKTLCKDLQTLNS